MLTKFAYKQFIRVGVRDVGRRVGSALRKCVNFTCVFLGAITKQHVKICDNIILLVERSHN